MFIFSRFSGELNLKKKEFQSIAELGDSGKKYRSVIILSLIGKGLSGKQDLIR